MLDAHKTQRFGFCDSEDVWRLMVQPALLLVLLSIATPRLEDARGQTVPEGAKKVMTPAALEVKEKANLQVGASPTACQNAEICPDCGRLMESGLLRSYTYELSWLRPDGSARKEWGMLDYPQVIPRIPVTASRCTVCGYLKLYAK